MELVHDYRQPGCDYPSVVYRINDRYYEAMLHRGLAARSSVVFYTSSRLITNHFDQTVTATTSSIGELVPPSDVDNLFTWFATLDFVALFLEHIL